MNAQEHEFIKFERGFKKILDGYGWTKFTKEDRLRLTREVWKGCGGDYEKARKLACIGALESNYFLPPEDQYDWYEGKSWTKVRGYFGCHTTTLLAEVKRLKVGGSKEMWSNYWKQDVYVAARYSASRFSFIVDVYGMEVGIRQWLTGDGWRTVKKDKVRSDRYLKNLKWLENKCFGG